MNIQANQEEGRFILIKTLQPLSFCLGVIRKLLFAKEFYSTADDKVKPRLFTFSAKR
jgi:hypothetical protein